ncbi:MAG: MarR family transcriptional regulator [Eubacteriales bacterium]|nr:MarR family transcriptional regulator [Eubacteriales bacterium]
MMTDNKNSILNDKLASIFFFYVSMNHEYLSKPFVEFFRTKYNLNRHQMAAVVYLKESKSLTMTQLSDKMSISKQQASQLVKSLVSKKLVTRHIYEDNRRVVYIEPTALAIQFMTEGEILFLTNAMEKIRQSIGDNTEKFESSIRYLSNVIPKIDFSIKDNG